MVVALLISAQRVPKMRLVPDQHAIQKLGAQCLDPVGFQNWVTVGDLPFYDAGRYSLIKPPRIVCCSKLGFGS
jgi:hypothetical protein